MVPHMMLGSSGVMGGGTGYIPAWQDANNHAVSMGTMIVSSALQM